MRAFDSDSTIRLARVEDAAGIAAAHIASWRATYPGIISDKTLAALRVEERAALWRSRLIALSENPPPRQEACYVAVGGAGEVVGFARGGPARPLASGAAPDPYDGELYAIYLAPGAERRGLGGRLTRAVARHLAADGLRSLLVWALAANPNRGFYEALGGLQAFEQETEIFGQLLPEVGYGWLDISALIMRASRQIIEGPN